MMRLELEIYRGLAVTALFIGYVILWAWKRRTMMADDGIDPEIIYKDKRPSQMFFAAAAKVMTVAIILLIIVHFVGLKNVPGFYYFFDWSDTVSILTGLVIGFLGLFICFVAQKTMGKMWRVGIDQGAETQLIITGLFSYCRNPTYLGLMLICCAAFFTFPTMSMLTWVAIFILMFEFQVRLEEEYLLEKHGDAYLKHCMRVKRYFPGIY